MQADYIPLIIGSLVVLSSLISLKFGLSVAIVEVVVGSIAGNFGLQPEAWMTYLASMGGIILTFLAGTEVDTKILRSKLKESLLIGLSSFLVPFIAVAALCYFLLNWNIDAAFIAGTALSTTSLAVIYSVLVETNMARSPIGKILMAATFITDMGTALALSILFTKPNLYTLLFWGVSIVVIFLAFKYSPVIFNHHRIKNKVIEPEIKYILLLILILMFFANLGEGHAVLPAFVLGLFMSRYFRESAETKVVRNRLRTVSYAIITPIFFIIGGMRVSYEMIYAALGLFVLFFAIKIAGKFLGVYFLARKYIPNGSMYTTLLMSTGLTFGTIASVFGLSSGIINQEQYSILVGVVIASAVIPTVVAQRWFMPAESEDLVEMNMDTAKDYEKRW